MLNVMSKIWIIWIQLIIGFLAFCSIIAKHTYSESKISENAESASIAKHMLLQDTDKPVLNTQNNSTSEKQCESSSSSRTIIIVLSVIIVILLLAVIGLSYLLREEIRIFCSDLCNGTKATTDEFQFTNDAFTNNKYEQHNPKITLSSVTSSNANVYIHNEAYTESNSSTSAFTTSTAIPPSQSTASTELIDDFDSDTETGINFPSPLNAPALPPRPAKDTSPKGDQIHYMVSSIY